MKTITEKGTYKTYIDNKGKIITSFKPTFSVINRKAFKKSNKCIKLVTPDEVILKNLKNNKMKLIKLKIHRKWVDCTKRLSKKSKNKK